MISRLDWEVFHADSAEREPGELRWGASPEDATRRRTTAANGRGRGEGERERKREREREREVGRERETENEKQGETDTKTNADGLQKERQESTDKTDNDTEQEESAKAERQREKEDKTDKQTEKHTDKDNTHKHRDERRERECGRDDEGDRRHGIFQTQTKTARKHKNMSTKSKKLRHAERNEIRCFDLFIQQTSDLFKHKRPIFSRALTQPSPSVDSNKAL